MKRVQTNPTNIRYMYFEFVGEQAEVDGEKYWSLVLNTSDRHEVSEQV